jgi:hypothetical protein
VRISTPGRGLGSAGMRMTGKELGLATLSNRDQSRLQVCSFQRKRVLILVYSDRRTGILLRKMMPPGTNNLISVPEFEELPSVSLPPMRAARSRIPGSPKCPSFPLSAIAGSMPVPLSPTNRTQSTQLENWRRARTNYQESLETSSDLPTQAALETGKSSAVEKLKQILAACDAAIARLQAR